VQKNLKVFCAGSREVLKFFKKYWYALTLGFIFAFAVIFRLEALIQREAWLDEVYLACNFIENDGFFWVFKPLKLLQMAPPFFLILTKFAADLFQGLDFSYRILPFTASIISIPIFYILSKKFLQTQRAIIFANFLYAINFALIRYASEFKQYSSDVLIFMLLLLWLDREDLSELNLKKVFKFWIVFSVSFFFSQPVIFLLFGFFAYQFLLNINEFKTSYKKILKICLIPVLPFIFAIFYKNSVPNYINDFMHLWWQDGFINIKNLFYITYENLNFFFYNIKCLIFLFPLIFSGFFILFFKNFKNKTLKKDYSKITGIFLFSLFGVIIASVLKFYPFLNRLILFLFPFFIIFISKNFDFKLSNAKFDKIFTIGLTVFVLIFLVLYSSLLICKNRSEEFRHLSRSKTVSLILKERFDKNTDILIFPRFNRAFYTFYDDAINLDIKKEQTIDVIFFEDEYLDKIFNKIDSDKFYWIYFPSYYTNPKNAEKLLHKVKQNGGAICYKIEFGLASRLYKVKFEGKQN